MNISVKEISGILGVLILLAISILLIFFPPLKFYNKAIGKNNASIDTQTNLQQKFQTSHHTEVTLESLIDRPLVLSTGFTRCGYSCPMTMIFMNKLLKSFDKKITAALLTVDPAYDTPKVLHDYLTSFPENMIGLRIKNEDELRLFLKKIGQRTYITQNTTTEITNSQTHHKNFVLLLAPSHPPQLFLNQNFEEIKSAINQLL